MTVAWKRNKPRRPSSRATRRQRAQVLARDRYTCQMQVPGVCTYVATEDDHIVPLAEGGSDDLNNRRAVCHPCHSLKTKEEARRGRARYRNSRTRPKPKHPGLV